MFGKDGLVVLGVNVWDEEKSDIAAFVKEKKLKHRILLNGRSMAKTTYRIGGLPIVLFIDRKGVVVDVHTSDDASTLKNKAAALLSAKPER